MISANISTYIYPITTKKRIGKNWFKVLPYTLYFQCIPRWEKKIDVPGACKKSPFVRQRCCSASTTRHQAQSVEVSSCPRPLLPPRSKGCCNWEPTNTRVFYAPTVVRFRSLEFLCNRLYRSRQISAAWCVVCVVRVVPQDNGDWWNKYSALASGIFPPNTNQWVWSGIGYYIKITNVEKEILDAGLCVDIGLSHTLA